MLAPWTDRMFEISSSDLDIYDRVLPLQSPLLDALELIDWEALDQQVRSFYSKDVGQPAIPPLIMLKLEFLSYFYRLSDAAVTQRASTDLLFRWFLQVPIRFRIPDSTSLTKFRGRLGSEGFKAVFDRLVASAREHKLIRDRLRLKDATHVYADIAVPTTLTLLAQLRERMLAIVHRIDPQACEGFEIRVEQMHLETKDQDAQIILQERLSLVSDILLWLKELPAQPPNKQSEDLWEKLSSVVQLAEKIVTDSLHPGQGDRTLSVFDPDARCGMHHGYYDGYMLDVMMDADSQLITEVEVLPANGEEALDGVHLVKMEQETHGNQIETLSIDGAGFHGPSLRILEDPEGLAVNVITPPHDFNTKDRYPSSQFELNADGDRVICPAGKESGKVHYKADKPNTSFFDFAKGACLECPLLAACQPDMKATSRTGRRVSKNEYEREYEAAREKAKTAEYQAFRREHPAIERKLNEIVRHHAGRRARYRGCEKVQIQQLLTCIAINVKRMVKLFQGAVCALSIE